MGDNHVWRLGGYCCRLSKVVPIDVVGMSTGGNCAVVLPQSPWDWDRFGVRRRIVATPPCTIVDCDTCIWPASACDRQS
jgi:hypothetical protein